MSIITISLPDDIEESFREFVKKEYGTGKGSIQKAIIDAVDKLMNEKKSYIAKKNIKLILKEGLYKLEKDYKFDRDELHER